MPLPGEHPLRRELSNEVHARPPEALCAPLRISFLAMHAVGEVRQQGWAHVQALVARFGVKPPGDGDSHFSADLGPFRLKCERHTEFLRFKFIVPGLDPEDPFADPAIGVVPADWLGALPGQLLVATNVVLLSQQTALPDAETMAQRWFDGNTLVGAAIAAGAGRAYTDFCIHPDGFGRLLVHDRGLTPRQAGRSVQRLLEIDTYRMLALLAFPLARGLVPLLDRGEQELAQISREVVDARPSDETALFDRLSRLEAATQSRQSENQFRFSAAEAYDTLVQRRIAELREERLSGLQTFHEFTERRLGPAMATCRSAAHRQELLSTHLARVTQLLSTRVDITREGQTQAVLESMNRRARLQLRLQETVEGLSVAAITYYIVALVGHLAEGAKAAGVPVDVEVATALAIPVVAGLIALGLWRLRRSLAHEIQS